MKIYFVRHGQSEMNIEEKEQGALGALSELGREQAAFVAKRFSDLPIDVIIASPYERAKETAEIINSHLKKEMVFSDLLAEWRPPSEIIGLRPHDPENVKIRGLMRDQKTVDPASRYSDEETFVELKERAISALKYLENLEKESVLVVTHGGILRTIIAALIMGEELTYPEYVKFLKTIRTRNTGITLIESKKASSGTPTQWQLIAWNDHAHL